MSEKPLSPSVLTPDRNFGEMRLHELALQNWFNRRFVIQNGFPIPVLFVSPMDAYAHYKSLWGSAQNPFKYLKDMVDDKGKKVYDPDPAPPRYPFISVYRKGWAYRPTQNYAYQEFRRVAWPTVNGVDEGLTRDDLGTVAKVKMPAAWDFKFQIDHFAATPQGQSEFVRRVFRSFNLCGGTPQTWIPVVYPGHLGVMLVRMYMVGEIDSLTPDVVEENKQTEYRTSFSATIEGYSPDLSYEMIPAVWSVVFNTKAEVEPGVLETLYTQAFDLRKKEDNPRFNTRVPLPPRS